MDYLESLGADGSIKFTEHGREVPVAVWHGVSGALHFHPANGSVPIRVGFYHPMGLASGLRIVAKMRRAELHGLPPVRRVSSRRYPSTRFKVVPS